MNRLCGTLCIAGLAVASIAAAQHANPVKRQELQAKGIANWTPGQNRAPGAPVLATIPPRAVESPEDTATMQYDDGNLTALPIVFGVIFGNRFSQGVGGVDLDTLTLNSFSFYFLEDSLPDTGLFFQPADALNTMSISVRTSTNISGLMNSGPSFMTPVLNVIDQTALGTTGMFNDTFFLGAWCLNSATMFPVDNEMIGLATNGPLQKGYTAVSAASGPVGFAAQAFNAILRANVTSAATVPVELMSFSVEN